MAISLIYKKPFFYRLLMLVLYGREYFKRFKTIAALIKNNSSVVELCCGFGDFYFSGLKDKEISYLGVDLSPAFVKYGLKKGLNIIERDINNFDFSPSDYYVMISSLYHFYPEPEIIIKKMLAAAKRNVIIVEPVKNWLNAKSMIISRLVLFLTDEGGGKNKFRFTEESLAKLMQEHFKENIVRIEKMKNKKEKIYILKK